MDFFGPADNAEAIIFNINQAGKRLPTDALLAKVIFILDICDSLQQINELLAQKATIEQTAKSEYMCRPVSATAASEGRNYEGDCVETLYRHLTNIAIQDVEDPSKLHTEKLCDSLYKYYFPGYKSGAKQETRLKAVSEAGLTSITRHNEWKNVTRINCR